MDLKSRVGQKAGPYHEEVTLDWLRSFAQAVRGRFRSRAPSTFMTICRRGEFQLLNEMGIPLTSVLHGEQEYRYETVILPGDTIRYDTELVGVAEKRGRSATMQLMAFETTVWIEKGQTAQGPRSERMLPLRAGLARSRILYREVAST